MSRLDTSGLDKARQTFESKQLRLPPVPQRFARKLRVIDPWCFATREVDSMRMYLFRDYFSEVLTTKTADYVAISHAGQGINSYALNYALVDGPLALFVQSDWGGIYSDKAEDTERANALFARCDELVLANGRAKARGLSGPPGRLVIIESEMRGALVWGWLDRPLPRKAVEEWLDEHLIKPLRDSSESANAELPTVAALRWLNTAPVKGSTKNMRMRAGEKR